LPTESFVYRGAERAIANKEKPAEGGISGLDGALGSSALSIAINYPAIRGCAAVAPHGKLTHG
jgi:hypothetical protein